MPGILTSRPLPGSIAVAALPLLAALLVGCGSQSAETSTGTDPASEPSAAGTSATPGEEKSSAHDGDEAGGDGGTAAVPAVLNFTGTTTDGADFDGASLAGKPAVLWFWAPWCPTCLAQVPNVTALSEKYGDNVGFVGVGSLDGADAIEGFAERAPELTQLSDPDGAVWQHFEITEQSVYVVLDAEGDVVADGFLPDEELSDLVAQLAG